MERRRTKSTAGVALLVGVALIVAPFVGIFPSPAWATVDCSNPSAILDSDGDGITDAQECTGITTAGVSPRSFPKCSGAPAEGCVHPDVKDVFICLKKATGSLLDTPGFEVTFNSFLGLFSPLGESAHGLIPEEAATDRTVVGTQKCIRIAESLDTNGTILGNCTWGTPLGLDGCTVFTKRMQNFIDSVCNGLSDTTTPRQPILRDMIIWGIVHEAGHTHGGLTSSYVSNYGGYHYKMGTPYIMEQALKYNSKKPCTFVIPTDWNTTLDPPAINLK